MIFDLFHSLSDPVVAGQTLGAARCFAQFLEQARLAEDLGMDTVWCAESHFSSETQKLARQPSIPNFGGEVGLNGDSFQLFHWLAANTRRIGLGTAIHNIVGGSGGPIASADRVNMLRFYNRVLWPRPRQLRLGVAAGRFPYQNLPFGIVPRDATEQRLWPHVQRIAFYEALEIFLRLLRGEALSHEQLQVHEISLEQAQQTSGAGELDPSVFPYRPAPRWRFETLRLVPEGVAGDLDIVLGSADPAALAVAQQHWNVDVFNLSFTPPDKIEALHRAMAAKDSTWSRERLPRTVLVFADPSPARALSRAEAALDTYVEAMRGTAQVPDKVTLASRALIGDAVAIREQLSPGGSRGFQPGDRLMLWFEFNQLDGTAILEQMRYFFEEVVAKC
jgi:alkanesulfonate monooxygenase SsuD/methylene tetrahydromethanopterin reductase-like flavin-dependent oxidoreductase (luciferase family)